MTRSDSSLSDIDEVVGATHESQLVDEARRGDQSAFGELVTRYERRLIRVILQFVKNQELAEDLAQESFLKAYQRLSQFDTARRFGPWLFRIGVNQTLDYLRRRKRRGFWLLFSERGTEKDPDPGVADPRLQLDMEQEVAAVLEQVPENYRIVLILRELQNFSTSEIATILERKEATVRWRLAEARSMFHDLWVKRRDAVSRTETQTAETQNSATSGKEPENTAKLNVAAKNSAAVKNVTLDKVDPTEGKLPSKSDVRKRRKGEG